MLAPSGSAATVERESLQVVLPDLEASKSCKPLKHDAKISTSRLLNGKMME